MENSIHENDSDEAALDRIREIIKNRNIHSSIQSTLKSLCEELEANDIRINGEEKFITYKKEIRTGKISITDIANLNFNSIFASKKLEREEAIILECLMLLACASIAEENQAIMIAWNLQSQANHKLGFYCGLTDLTKSEHAERGRRANAQRLKNANEEYNLLLKLIHDMKPPRGWRSKADAAEQVGKRLFSEKLNKGLRFSSTEERNKAENDFIGYILTSIIENKDILKVYNSKPSTKHHINE
ncbi:TPA: hypothetical protein QEM53_004523 [Pseudomonas putida]|uniref:hypothetical protein n=1 Tax=Pseudomonas putida TaxID=303 RepID=UPI00235D7733|nr:hypothetical protein [Pseudomonas putida]GLO16781.1 hypothetical protein PPUJ20188_01740 [Pseudomonas putida]HDS0994096.1 hypothetical protein [Pseudomonas putida]HDS1763583.1 hypothetical protein [Pseudomonas putida]